MIGEDRGVERRDGDGLGFVAAEAAEIDLAGAVGRSVGRYVGRLGRRLAIAFAIR